jgi:hypothetical protein
VKAKALLLFISFVCGPTVYSFGQIDCTGSNKLVCELPATTTYLLPFGASSGITAQAVTESSSINASIATQLTQLPLPSAAVGLVNIQQKGSEVGLPFYNLGPILTDRPDTVGKKRVFVGFSYQHFNFNAIDGIDMKSLPLGFALSQPAPGNPADIQTFYVADINKVSFQLNQYVGVATFGFSKTTDVSVVVPINSVSLAVTSSNSQAYVYDSVSQTYSIYPPSSQPASTTGSATGIGDVSLSVKQLLIGGEGSRAAIAAGATIRIPTGDSLNYLGSGAVGGNLYGLFEYRARLAPHLKLSYQWNDVSKLAINPTTGANSRLPGGLQYAAGADYKIRKNLTVAADVLGNQFVNTTSAVVSTLTPIAATVGATPPSLTGLSLNNDTYSTVNFSAGLKCSVGHFLFYGNVLTQLNNVGLRSDPVPLFGIAFRRFGKKN